ncbi:MAG: hypothetical protein ACKVP7_23445 [Hyphomicrobiaceae bacterium]
MGRRDVADGEQAFAIPWQQAIAAWLPIGIVFPCEGCLNGCARRVGCGESSKRQIDDIPLHVGLPMVTGQVVYVSADAIQNERNQATDNAYVTRVKLDVASVAVVQKFLPTPGMPAEVYIRTGERTFFQYLARPITDVMSRAFRES